MQIQKIDIVCEDGYTLKGKLYFCDQPQQKNTIIISPALAVPQSFYSYFAEYLTQKNYTVITYDYRGIAESLDPTVDGSTLLMEHWGRYDFHAVMEMVLSELQPAQLYLIGHSAGGQLIGLSDHSRAIDGMVFVTTPNGYWKNYNTPFKYALAFFWYIVVPALSHGRNYFPARLLKVAPKDVPSGVMCQWAQWCRSEHYLFEEKHGFDLSNYQALTVPVLAYSFTDDNFAPEKAVDSLLTHFPNTRITHKSVKPSDHNKKHIGHFGFFRPSMQDTLWEETLNWLSSLEQ